MCGIAGYINFNNKNISSDILFSMSEAIKHRGPDGYGIWLDNHIGLAHRRLAIIDTSDLGRQPMHTSSDRYVISYNGEIYNFKELKAELIQLGVSFKTHTDTEVLLEAFEKWGLSSIAKLNGMFAFAIWDKIDKTLTIVRDRYGIKPLYYYLDSCCLVFASEIKAILKHPNVRVQLDLNGLREYFTFQNFFSDKTLHQNISLLEKGSYVQINIKEKQFRPVRYWDYHFQEDNDMTQEEATLEIERLLAQAVKRQLMSDVSLGCYLSGGMDSGSITMLASKSIQNMNTFTIGFDKHSSMGLEIGFDEREKSEYMSYLAQTEHYEMVLKSGDMERSLNQLVYHLEEPRVGQSYPNFYAAKLASKFVKVVLAGSGGDELFGGYPWRYYRTVGSNDFEHYIDQYYNYWQRLVPNSVQEKLFAPIWSDVKDYWTRDVMSNVFKTHQNLMQSPVQYIQHSLYFEANTFLHGLLVVEDKLSMAHGIENRVPFLDNDLVDFAMMVPVKYKVGRLDEVIRLNENGFGRKDQIYFEKTHDGKLVLREAMRKILPKDITEAVKQGFSSPDSAWFKGDSIDYVRDILYNKNAKIYSYMDYSQTLALVGEHLSGKQNRRLLIWSLLYVEQFLHQFMSEGHVS